MNKKAVTAIILSVLQSVIVFLQEIIIKSNK